MSLSKLSTAALRAELLSRYQAPKRIRLMTPEAIAQHLWPLMVRLEREEFHVLCLNSRNELLCHEVVAHGTIDQCFVDPRMVFKPAILSGCTGLVLAHNHPSGDPEPSVQDVALTQRLQKGARDLCIRLLDHLVLGRPSGAGDSPAFVSMLGRGLFKDNDSFRLAAAERG